MKFSRSRAFTLVELLVVIAVIIVLAGMIFAVGPAVIDRGKKVQASSDLAQMNTAVKSYYTDYGQYPLGTDQQAGGGDAVWGEPGGALYHNQLLFNALRGITTVATQKEAGNPRGIVYIEPREANDAKNPKSGIAREGATTPKGDQTFKGAWLDPWGSEYLIFVDADYNGYLDIGLIYKGVGPGGGPRQGVGSASLGKNGQLGNGGAQVYAGTDDIVSW